ncbi:hypothetical protein ACPCUF_29575 [Streptomyces griseoincarnatus]
MAGARERAAVADGGQEDCGGPDADAGHRGRPDPTRVRGKIRLWRQEWAAAGGEVDRAAALTLPHLLKCRKQCDESTNIGKRDAFMLTLNYSNLHRRAELTDLLVKHVKILPTGLLVTTATSKMDRQAKGSTEFLADRDDIRLVDRAKAWVSVSRSSTPTPLHSPSSAP